MGEGKQSIFPDGCHVKGGSPWLAQTCQSADFKCCHPQVVINNKRGGGFKKAKGKGSVVLKCEAWAMLDREMCWVRWELYGSGGRGCKQLPQDACGLPSGKAP